MRWGVWPSALALVGLTGCTARFGPAELSTGNPYLDIIGIIVIVLVIALGMKLIGRIGMKK